MRNIYLIGMPGCGKSTIGKVISKEINREFLDLDEYIVEQSEKSIDDLFSVGESHFREAETQCLKQVGDMDNLIVATGGGIIETSGNDEIMKKSGTVIFIHTAPNKIIENSPLDGRPLLAENKNRIFELFEKRYGKYKSAADYIVDNMGDIEDTIKNILDIIKGLNC